jgi:murein DD-endopeptidase MepM/ murein hydrolase activator NlpD
MYWNNPLPLKMIPTEDTDSWSSMPVGTTGIPTGPDHPGAFGVKRKHHTHEGVDLYCPEGTAVRAVEKGRVVAVIPFTGPNAEPASPWWHDTQAVLVEGASGVVVYGEIKAFVKVDDEILVGQLLGTVTPVLTKDKGRPMTMLHLELHVAGTRDAYEWLDERPASLLDPTSYLLEAMEHRLDHDQGPAIAS